MPQYADNYNNKKSRGNIKFEAGADCLSRTLLKFTTKEGSKAANGSLFRIENVIFVTNLHDTVSKRKEDTGRMPAKKKSQSFHDVLQQACEDMSGREISYTTSGYTKNGLAYHRMEKLREYF